MLLKENIPVTYIFGKIKKEVIMVTVYAVLIAIMYNSFHFTRISIPIAVPTILGTVISLLLAFKSNQAYDRWWEARTIWGAIVNDTRSLTRQLLTFVDTPYAEEEQKAFCERVAKRQVAWCHSLSRHLRKEDPLQGLDRLISAEDIEHVKRYANIPLGLLELQGADLRAAFKLGWITEYQQVAIDETLTRFSNEMGGCERIKKYRIPGYVQRLHPLVGVIVCTVAAFWADRVFWCDRGAAGYCDSLIILPDREHGHSSARPI
jgi:putative membrane protein